MEGKHPSQDGVRFSWSPVEMKQRPGHTTALCLLAGEGCGSISPAFYVPCQVQVVVVCSTETGQCGAGHKPPHLLFLPVYHTDGLSDKQAGGTEPTLP